MKGVTLADLETAFETARSQLAALETARYDWSIVENLDPHECVDVLTSPKYKGQGMFSLFAYNVSNLVRSSKIYLVARDEGLEAAMLWKLSI